MTAASSRRRTTCWNAWLSIVPGNGAHNSRRLALRNEHRRSQFCSRSTTETPSPHLGKDLGSIRDRRIERRTRSTFMQQDVGHYRWSRRHRAARASALNFLITHAQSLRPPDGGARHRTQLPEARDLLGGCYLEPGLRHHGNHDQPVRFEPTPEHLHFLHALFVRCSKAMTGMDQRPRGSRDPRGGRESLRAGPEPAAIVHIREPVAASVGGSAAQVGRRRSLCQSFDNIEDTLTVERFQVFDLSDAGVPCALEPAVLRPAPGRRSHSGTDRSAAAFKCASSMRRGASSNTRHCAHVQEGLKTWRKHNAAMILATQTADDFCVGGSAAHDVESCPTKLLLANPAVDRRHYAEPFQLNEMELIRRTGLIPRQQILLKRPTWQSPSLWQ